MKTLKLVLALTLSTTLFTSCYREEIIVAPLEPTISLNQMLNTHDLWYVDINQTSGYGETPFLQIAFTLSFRNGTLYANNNLVGIGEQGNGFGIPVGSYDTYDMVLDIYHDLDGFNSFDVYQIDSNTIELYDPFSDTSYFLEGYQRSNFDYDFVFYDNIHYFLQEYDAWEKTYTSEMGVLNEFDNENYLQFTAENDDSVFRSSQDMNVPNPDEIIWDYTGIYGVGNVANDQYLKTLTLDYDYFDEEYFDLSVLNDATIELYHKNSGTVYEFIGVGYIQIMRLREGSTSQDAKKDRKKRKQRTAKRDNPRYNTRA